LDINLLDGSPKRGKLVSKYFKKHLPKKKKTCKKPVKSSIEEMTWKQKEEIAKKYVSE